MAPFLLVMLATVLLHTPPPSLGAGYGEGADTIDITKILAGFKGFSNFSAMLYESNIAMAINSRDKVTVLAPNNTAIAKAFGGVAKIPRSFLADLLALHTVLDYIDEPRLGELKRRRGRQGSVVTTLLQTMRDVPPGTGCVRIYSGREGLATISSAAPGGIQNATVERVLVAEPYSLAVLHVSSFVVPPGVRVPKPFPPAAPRARHMAAPPVPAPATPPGPGARHMAAPPRQAPVPAPGPRQEPIVGSGPLVPSPVRPMPTPNLTSTPPPAPEETGVIPIPRSSGGMAAKVPETTAGAGRSAASWWTGAVVALGIMTCLNLHL